MSNKQIPAPKPFRSTDLHGGQLKINDATQPLFNQIAEDQAQRTEANQEISPTLRAHIARLQRSIKK